jgi:hypothetical protein
LQHPANNDVALFPSTMQINKYNITEAQLQSREWHPRNASFSTQDILALIAPESRGKYDPICVRYLEPVARDTEHGIFRESRRICTTSLWSLRHLTRRGKMPARLCVRVAGLSRRRECLISSSPHHTFRTKLLVPRITTGSATSQQPARTPVLHNKSNDSNPR